MWVFSGSEVSGTVLFCVHLVQHAYLLWACEMLCTL